MNDADREDLIDVKRLEFLGAPREQRMKLFEELRELIAGRSPAQVERMERERGLR
jgi:hypothetical protein